LSSWLKDKRTILLKRYFRIEGTKFHLIQSML
jgi:hypothetical protein